MLRKDNSLTLSFFYGGWQFSRCVLCLHISSAFPNSRRQKWETVEKYDQCLPVMCVWNPRRLSKLLARKRRPRNHGNGRSSHAEGGSEPGRWGSYWFFDGHRRGFMRNTMTRPLCCADGQPLWECRLYNDDGCDTCDQTPHLLVWNPPPCELEQESASQVSAHIRWRNRFCKDMLFDRSSLGLRPVSFAIMHSILRNTSLLQSV